MLEDIINPTPARQLINDFYYQLPNNGSHKEGLLSCERRYNEAITCALICVKQIIENYEFDSIHDLKNTRVMDNINYWDKVKDELIQIQNDQMEIQTGG
jgi:hypothetical protein